MDGGAAAETLRRDQYRGSIRSAMANLDPLIGRISPRTASPSTDIMRWWPSEGAMFGKSDRPDP